MYGVGWVGYIEQMIQFQIVEVIVVGLLYWYYLVVSFVVECGL